MSYQLVEPDLSVIGTPGLCEKYTEDVFGVTSPRHDADATAGWEQDNGQHPGETPPAELSVPIAFDWYGTVDGVYKNWGHRCVWHKGRIYSSPLSGTGHLEFSSIADIKSAFGLGSYLGWSEYIEDKQIVKGGSMAEITTEMVVALSLGTQGTQPQSKDEYEQWIGKSDQQSFDDMITHYSQKGQTRQAALEAAAVPATPLKPGVYKFG